MDYNKLLEKPLLFRKKLQLAGKKVWVLDDQGKMVLFVKGKPFKLKEDIRVYTDTSRSKELFNIKARQILDFSAGYDVFDSESGEKTGALARKGLKSLIRDEWEILDKEDKKIGTITEDTPTLAIVRRFLTNLIPQSFSFTVGEKKVAELRQHFNPFIFKATLATNSQEKLEVDPRLILAGAILLMTIEERQG